MNKTKLIWAAALLLVTACASEDTAQTGEQKKETATNGYATFVAGKEPTQTRTSLDYNTGKFYWEAGDNIFVKDDAGTWQTASNAVSGTAKSYYKFQLSGAFSGTSYTVFYPGKNGTNDQVTIATAQTQTTPADTKHLGESGDCGLATATGTGTDFGFNLDHKAAYLVFQPYTSDALLKDCYLTKIEVISDNNIAGTYTLDPTAKKLTGTGTSNTITLTTKGTGAYTNGFPMTTTSASLATNGAYMVIAPGHHTLQVRYWLKSLTDNIEGTVTKQLSNFDYEENNYYDMTADLKISHTSNSDFYEWDAKQNFWYGHLDANGNPDNLSNFPHPGEDRYFNNVLGYSDPTGTAPAITASHTAAGFPNANELYWYVQGGDPHWDTTELWAFTGHLHVNGMWLRKKGNIPSYSATVAPDGIDYTRRSTTPPSYYGNTIITTDKPGNLDDYFYLPDVGEYDGTSGCKLSGTGYWSSTPTQTGNAYFLYISSGAVSLGGRLARVNGFRLWQAQ